MAEGGFLRRWARVKAGGPEAQAEPEATVQAEVQLPGRAPVPPSEVAPWPWGRAGDTLQVAPAAASAVAPAVVPGPAEAPGAGSPGASGRSSPTLDDVARLTPDSDYSIFVGQGVDKSVQRLALKKLFADPHFNVMDRLDMYMDDYNIPSPVSAEMLASLDHARSALRRFVEEPAAAPPAEGSVAAAEALAADDPGALPQDAVPDAGAQATCAAPEAPEAPDAPDAPSHNEAAHAVAAHEARVSGQTPAATAHGAHAHDTGPFHRPHQYLPESQA